ncbi:MAG: FAD-dependent oxidoreductase [Chloroflexi bacterium]|nr:FAD-dependent oxidoreductase [Chloroflexota bacterium]
MIEHRTDVLIVGGGIAGLLATRVLRERGVPVMMADKAVRVGGRLATRRIGPGRGDHGAQFFTVRSREFGALVEEWIAAGLVYEWARGFSDGSLRTNSFDGYPRYAVRGGMNNLAQHLAEQLQPGVRIESSARVRSVVPLADGWQTTTEDQQVFFSRAVGLTPPVPQSLALLNRDLLTEADREILTPMDYEPCLTGIFWVDGRVDFPEPGAVQQPDAPVSWIADNQRKGISPEAVVVTVQASPEFSRQLRDLPETSAIQALKLAIEPYLVGQAVIKEGQLKAWRYALPKLIYPERYLLAQGLPPLVFAGDAFGGPRVEGAALSGLAAGNVLAACLGK